MPDARDDLIERLFKVVESQKQTIQRYENLIDKYEEVVSDYADMTDRLICPQKFNPVKK